MDGNFVQFCITDIPVKISDSQFILARREGSKVLKLGSIRMVMDHLPLGENDVISVDGAIYTVSYFKGFHAGPIASDALKDYTLIQRGEKGSQKLLFRVDDFVFGIEKIMGLHNGKVVIQGLSRAIDAKEIQMSAGFRVNKRRMFYGDTLVMHKGRPCIRKEDSYESYR